jgi:acetyl-CoA acetyltransferase
MRDAYVVGVGMTRFGKHLERSAKSLAGEATRAALSDAGLGADALQAAFVGNAVQGIMTGQECVRGQIVLRELGIGGIPVVNVENACASASTALHLPWPVACTSACSRWAWRSSTTPIGGGRSRPSPGPSTSTC